MGWISLLSNLIKLVLWFIKYLERQQLIESVKAAELKRLMESADEVVNDALNNRASVKPDDDLSDDEFNRDRKSSTPTEKGNKKSDL